MKTKELTIEEKAKAYDRALANAKEQAIDGYLDAVAVIDIFPELAESEDERIKKNIIATIHLYYGEPLEDEAKEMIAWLEKQGEHSNFLSKIQVGDKVTRNEDGVLVNLSQLNRVAKKDEKQGKNNMGISEATKKKLEDNLTQALEKETPESWNKFLDEQKPADKVEPKFEIGDTMRTLQEAKDGWTDGMPVVVSIDDTSYHCTNETIDIKDQDDYEYPPINRKHNSWSEEDEKIIIQIRDAVEDYFPTPVADKIKSRLKSLKERCCPQNTWKPSEEQMDALRYVTNFDYGGHKATLVSLYEQLKKLKG